MGAFARTVFKTFPLLVVSLCLFGMHNVRADIASPDTLTVLQPNGTEIPLRAFGDEFESYLETLDGYTVLRGSDGYWKYAARDETGVLRASNVIIDNDTPPEAAHLRLGSTIRQSIAGEREQVWKQGYPYTSRARAESRARAQGEVFGISGTEEILVICIDFSDQVASLPVSTVEAAYFGTTSSMKAYYEEISYGNLTVSGEVGGGRWVRSSEPLSKWGADTGPNDSNPNTKDDGYFAIWELAKDAVEQLDATGFDFSPYDTDGDGIIDHIAVVVAGLSYEPQGIWPHRWVIGTNLVVDGVQALNYTIVTEQSISWDGTIRFGTLAHEFGHDLGLPDLYDIDQSSEGIGEWGLMGSGNHNRQDSPAHMCAWSKIDLGWITPDVVSQNRLQQNVSNAEETSVVYKLPIPDSEEYFLVENRQRIGSDQHLNGTGLLIWHIDDGVIAANRFSNTVNTDENHLGVALEQADGRFDLESYTNRGDSGDPWPGTSDKRIFNDASTPDTRDYLDRPTGIAVANISDSSDPMTADLVVQSGSDVTPPTPDPMTWATEPRQTSSSSISMVSTTASDPSTPISYYFDFHSSPTGGSGGNDSGWQTSTSYTDGGLESNHQYGYRVQARDSSSPQNETDPSSTGYAYTDIEKPSGIAFGTIDTTNIAVKSSNMPSGLARGTSGLMLENVTMGTSSEWRQNNDYWNSSSLAANTEYEFRAKARNGDADETAYCAPAHRHTHANVPGEPIVTNLTSTTLDVDIATGGNPSWTEFAIYNGTGAYYVNAAGGNNGATSVWQTDIAWGTTRVTDLSSNTIYSFWVKARNGDRVETAFSAKGSETTEPSQTDNTPPTPNTIVSISAVSATRIDVVSTTATDDESPPVYYQLDGQYYTGSEWTDDGIDDYAYSVVRPAPWSDTGLLENGLYRYRQKVKDSAVPDANESPWSSWYEMSVLLNPPVDGGMVFSDISVSGMTISISAPPKPSGVGLTGAYFDLITGEGQGSGAMDRGYADDYAAEYTDLDVNTQYGWKAKYRNHSGVETPYNTTEQKRYTLANVPSAPTLGNPTEATLDVVINPNGSPPWTECALYNATAGYYVSANGGSSGSTPIWRTHADWGTVTVTGLYPQTTYHLRTKARNGDHVETEFGLPGVGTTAVEEDTALISLPYGWSLASVPVIPSDPNVRAVFPEMVVYAYDCEIGSYTMPLIVRPGLGYWVANFDPDTTIAVTGRPVTSYTDILCRGWSMIGSTSQAVSFSTPDDDPDGSIISGTLYGYDPITLNYVLQDSIKPGLGYWVAARRICELTVSNPILEAVGLLANRSGKGTRQDSSRSRPLWEGSIIITEDDASVFPVALGFGMASHATEDYDAHLDRILPPAPVGGVLLDAYFRSSDPRFARFARDIRQTERAQSWTLVVRSGSRTNLSWDVSDVPDDLGLMLYVDGHQLDMRQEQQYLLSREDHEKIAAIKAVPVEYSEVLLPYAFRLFQNHPNPFNPQTEIRYEISSSVGDDVRVVLAIYNLQGQLVRALVDRDQGAGNHTVSWDAKDDTGQDVGSGIYFYRLQADGRSILKKMTLLR